MENQNAINIILSYFRRWREKRKAKYDKMMKHRYYVIKEIMNTEERYIQDLTLVQNLKQELFGQIRPYYEYSIFQNIDEIIQVNKQFYNSLMNNYQGYSLENPFKEIFVNIDISNFTAYFLYCNGYTNAVKALTEITIEEQDLNFIERVKNFAKQTQHLQLEDFLVKPIQRLPKYILLLNDLMKNTPKSQVMINEYKNIEQLLNNFKDMNDKNNQNMDKHVNRQQVKQISEELNNKEIYNDNANRLFCFQEPRTIIYEKEQIPVTVYFFTDLIVVAQIEVQGNKIMKMLTINKNSQIKDQKDTRYYQNLYSIIGTNNLIQFKADNQQNKTKQLQQLENLLQYVKKETNDDGHYPIQVRAIGTEERNSSSLNKHTVYILEVQIEKIVQKIYIRYSEAQALSERVKKLFPKLQIESFSSRYWLKNHTTKVIEQRQIAIENLIQSILAYEDVPKHLEILESLDLPLDFFDLPKQNQMLPALIRDNFNQKQQHHSATQILQMFYDEQEKQKINIGQILDTIPFYNQEIMQSTITQNHKQSIKVFLPNDTVLRIYITHKTRGAELVKAVAIKLGLKFYRDYRIRLYDQAGGSKLIADDEIIAKLISNIANEGLLTKSINKIGQLFVDTYDQKFTFVKYLFLNKDIEELDFYTNNELQIIGDPVRMTQITNQILQEVTKQKFDLSLANYCTYAALMQKYRHVEFCESMLRDFIPKQVYEQLSPQEWINKVKAEITKISQYLQSYITENKSEEYLCQQMILNTLKENPLVSMNMYFLDIHKDSIKYLAKNGKLSIHNLYLGINYDKVHLLQPQNRQPYMFIEYQDIEDIKSYPNKLLIICKNKEEWKFVTLDSFEIKMLIQFYTQLAQFRQQIK